MKKTVIFEVEVEGETENEINIFVEDLEVDINDSWGTREIKVYKTNKEINEFYRNNCIINHEGI